MPGGAGISDPYVPPPLPSLLWRLLLDEDFWRVLASLRARSSSSRNWSTRALSPAACRTAASRSVRAACSSALSRSRSRFKASTEFCSAPICSLKCPIVVCAALYSERDRSRAAVCSARSVSSLFCSFAAAVRSLPISTSARFSISAITYLKGASAGQILSSAVE